jgi:hypothetical protein
LLCVSPPPKKSNDGVGREYGELRFEIFSNMVFEMLKEGLKWMLS